MNSHWDTGGWQSQQHITVLNLFAGDEFCFLNHTDSKAGNIILPGRIKTGHLSSLAANQGAARFLAGTSYL